MGGNIRLTVKRIIGPFVLKLCAFYPNRLCLDLMRRCFNIQLAPHQMMQIVSVVKKRQPCRFLVFGVGHDSSFWAAVNREGITVFLEDNDEWLQKVRSCYPNLKIRKSEL